MAPEVTTEIEIDATPNEVFAVLADPDRLSEWLPGVESVDVRKHKGQGAGAERVVRLKLYGLDVVSHQRVIHHEPGRRYGWRHERDLVGGKKFEMVEDVGIHFDLDPKGKRTLVQARISLKPKGLRAKVAMPFIEKDIARQIELALENLRTAVEEARTPAGAAKPGPGSSKKK